MKVKLVQYNTDLINVIYTACRTCYSKLSPIEIYEKAQQDDDTEKKIKLIKKVMDSGHLSTVEHVNFTFAIEGISRVCSHQTVRHRHCSFSQQSQRYVEIKENIDELYDVSDEIREKEIVDKYFVTQDDKDIITHCFDSLLAYRNLVNKGVKPEDARAVLPNCTKTNLVMTCNLRELILLCNLRLCKQAQGEIREMMQLMVKAVTDNPECSWLKKYLVPGCKNCTDFRDCKGKQ